MFSGLRLRAIATPLASLSDEIGKSLAGETRDAFSSLADMFGPGSSYFGGSRKFFNARNAALFFAGFRNAARDDFYAISEDCWMKAEFRGEPICL